MINHRELLKKYMEHIGRREGTYFLGVRRANLFSQEEWDELLNLSEESSSDFNVIVE